MSRNAVNTVALSREQWNAIAAMLPLPWPDAAVDVDLHFNAQSSRPMGRVLLMRRWGWTATRVRTALAHSCLLSVHYGRWLPSDDAEPCCQSESV